MPLLIAAVVVIIVVAIVAYRRSPTRNCRWREDRAGSKGALVKYNCVTCGAEAFRSQGKPDSCLSRLNKPGL
jgi:hypothetical protein